MDDRARRLKLALPYVILAEGDAVLLVGGEDFRYTLTAPDLSSWLPQLLERLDGRLALRAALETVAPPRRDEARSLLERLLGERILVDGTARDAHPAAPYELHVEGTGPLFDLLTSSTEHGKSDQPLRVYCQDRLDYSAALQFNTQSLQGDAPWLWVSTGAMQRGYVSPVFLPDAGPCLACLIGQFQRLSPMPEVYDALVAHADRGEPIPPAPFPAPATEILRQLVLWKRQLLAHAAAPAALYQLHVLEVESLEINSHRLFRDHECPTCRSHR